MLPHGEKESKPCLEKRKENYEDHIIISLNSNRVLLVPAQDKGIIKQGVWNAKHGNVQIIRL